VATLDQINELSLGALTADASWATLAS